MGKLDFSPESNESYSLRGRVYKQLRTDILSGKYNDNEELRENAFAKEYGVSRTPVREAIRQLEREGLAVTIPNRGAYVNTIKPKDIEDIYAIRSLLEGLCARWAARYITPEQLEAVEEILFMTRYHLEHEHFDQLYEYDGKFHDALYGACNSPMLNHLLKGFNEYIKMARKTSLKDRERAVQCQEEYEAILAAIKAGDPEESARLASLHIEKAVANRLRKSAQQDT